MHSSSALIKRDRAVACRGSRGNLNTSDLIKAELNRDSLQGSIEVCTPTFLINVKELEKE
jgi:hypothetical protein